MYDELMETLDLPKEELIRFADAVMERFTNPYVDHQLTSIMLNSFSKFATRDLPGLKTYLARKTDCLKDWFWDWLPSLLITKVVSVPTGYAMHRRILRRF